MAGGLPLVSSPDCYCCLGHLSTKLTYQLIRNLSVIGIRPIVFHDTKLKVKINNNVNNLETKRPTDKQKDNYLDRVFIKK